MKLDDLNHDTKAAIVIIIILGVFLLGIVIAFLVSSGPGWREKHEERMNMIDTCESMKTDNATNACFAIINQ